MDIEVGVGVGVGVGAAIYADGVVIIGEPIYLEEISSRNAVTR